MADFATGEDIVKSVLDRSGELSDGNSPFNARALEYVNGAYQAILSGANLFSIDIGERWNWAKSQNSGVLTLEPPEESGTVSLTQGSNAGTFSVAHATSQAGRFLKVLNRSTIYRIATHTGGANAFTLDAEYVDDTGATLTYKSLKLDYTLVAGIQRLIAPMRVYREQGLASAGTAEIAGLDLARFNEAFPRVRISKGVPTFFTEVYDSDGTITVRFNRYLDKKTRAEYDYIPIPAALANDPGSIPLIPREHRQVLVYAATYWLMLDKSDSRADSYLRQAQAALQAMIKSNRKEQSHHNRDFARIITRPEENEIRIRTGITTEL